MRYVIACIVAIAVGVPIVAYTERSRVSHDIEAVLHEWAATWNISDAQERVAARNKLTCARSQARQSNSQLGAPRKVVPDTEIDMQRGLTAFGVGPTLRTAYARATVTSTVETNESDNDSRTRRVSDPFGFELAKEAGRWKVCNWDKDLTRIVIFGWMPL